MSVCSKLCGVVDRNFGGVPARDPGRLIKCFIGVLLIAVGVNLLSSFVATQKWAWLPPAVFVAALLVAVPSAGLLRPGTGSGRGSRGRRQRRGPQSGT